MPWAKTSGWRGFAAGQETRNIDSLYSPCVIVSPNEVNQHLKTVTVVPLTSSLKAYPTRVPIQFQNKQGEVAVDQIRSIDKARLIGRLGQLDQKTGFAIYWCRRFGIDRTWGKHYSGQIFFFAQGKNLYDLTDTLA